MRQLISFIAAVAIFAGIPVMFNSYWESSQQQKSLDKEYEIRMAKNRALPTYRMTKASHMVVDGRCIYIVDPSEAK